VIVEARQVSQSAAWQQAGDSDWCTSNLQAFRLKTQEELTLQFKSGQKKPVTQFKGLQAGRILLLKEGQPWFFDWLDEAYPPTLGRAIAFLRLLNQMLTSSKNTLTETSGIIFDQVFGPSCGPFKLTKN
jgi:hypothetical protein